jgi:hypothetical protein
VHSPLSHPFSHCTKITFRFFFFFFFFPARARGSSLCDVAILVVDINSGIQPQTMESLQILRKRKTPFIIALNKVDRVYRWDIRENEPFATAYERQEKLVKEEFEEKLKKVMWEFSVHGFNTIPYYKNKDFLKNVSICPISALHGLLHFFFFFFPLHVAGELTALFFFALFRHWNTRSDAADSHDLPKVPQKATKKTRNSRCHCFGSQVHESHRTYFGYYFGISLSLSFLIFSFLFLLNRFVCFR